MSAEFEEHGIVYALVAVMKRRLQANRHKSHWSYDSQLDLLKKLRAEVEELDEAIKLGSVTIIDECADVANFAAMIADKARGRSEKPCT